MMYNSLLEEWRSRDGSCDSRFVSALCASDLEALRIKYPELPDEYFEFINVVGLGDVPDPRFGFKYGPQIKICMPVVSSKLFPMHKHDDVVVYLDCCDGSVFGFRQGKVVFQDCDGSLHHYGIFSEWIRSYFGNSN